MSHLINKTVQHAVIAVELIIGIRAFKTFWHNSGFFFLIQQNKETTDKYT